jgi:HrpA-like RNA helicase
MAHSVLGAILVFLSGYDDIINLRERITAEDKKLTEASKYTLYTLHSNMQVRIRTMYNYETTFVSVV